MSQTIRHKHVLISLVTFAVVYILISLFIENPAGGADNYAHFNISRWAFRYPHLFLDHWGKPIFTLLTAPLAQFGISGVRIFNIVCGTITAYYVFRLSTLFSLKNSWFGIVLTLFTPIYFVILSSGMTEILFSLFLVLALFFFFKERYIASALIVSFIFLVRTEGLAFMPLFIIGFLIRGKLRVVPFLLTGFIVYSLLGWLAFDYDLLWLISKRPYATGGTSVYGSGAWYYYFKKAPFYFGYIVSIVVLGGTGLILLNWIRCKGKLDSTPFLLIILVLGSFWGYFFIHSFLWWKGITSAGLVRVMAGVSPVAVLIGAFFWNKLSTIVKSKRYELALLILVSAYMIAHGIQFYKGTVKGDVTLKLRNQAADWVKDAGLLRHKLVVHNPYFAYATGVDAWDNEKVQYGFSDNSHPENGLVDSTVFIWDAHFSANEGGMPLKMIMENRNFELIKYFEPAISHQVLGNQEYKIFVFQKSDGVEESNYQKLQQIQESEFNNGIYLRQDKDFEAGFDEKRHETNRIKDPRGNGNMIYTLDGVEFGPAFIIETEEINSAGKNRARISLDAVRHDSLADNKLLMVFSLEKRDKSYHYATADINRSLKNNSEWYKVNLFFNFPDNIIKGSQLKIYIWNIDKNNVQIDNFKVELSEVQGRL